MSVLARLFRIAWRFSTLIVLVAMLGLNVATLTVSGVAAAANGALAAVGVGTVAARSAAAHAAAAAPRRAAVRAATRRVSARVARGAARNAGAVFAEAVPWVGAAAVIGFAALDLRDACATPARRWRTCARWTRPPAPIPTRQARTPPCSTAPRKRSARWTCPRWPNCAPVRPPKRPPKRRPAPAPTPPLDPRVPDLREPARHTP
ncbi:MAG: hypothetical protein VYD87_20755 [Pseudomonadota bacterium]|nr:hypothetical protein [Pseudomonadota bacterium]